jgi:hypothetical protein
MEPRNQRRKFGGWTTKTKKEKAQLAEEHTWAEKSSLVETRQQTLGEYLDWLMQLTPQQYEEHMKNSGK